MTYPQYFLWLTLIAIPVTARALSVARPEDVFCGASHVVVAEIEDVVPEIKGITFSPNRCFNQPETHCECSGQVVVKVKRLLGVKSAVSQYPEEVGISEGKEVRLNLRRLPYVFPLVRSPASQACRDIQVSLHGQEFIFSVWTHYGSLKDVMNLVTQSPYSAHSWPSEMIYWVQGMLARSNGISCPAVFIPETKTGHDAKK